MRSLAARWAMFLAILAIAVVPAWLGEHFRSFLPFVGAVAAFAVLTTAWLRYSSTEARTTEDDR